MKKMNKLCAMLILCTVILMSFPLQVNAESLWVDDSSGLNLFADRKARLVGDSLTIIIKESSNASRSGSSNNSKSGSNTLAAGTGIFDFLAAASASGEDKFQSSGKITNTNTVTGKITVQVTEVKPNGNLVVSGTQSIKQNTDLHTITITGIVRPDDIAADNTVLSSYVANAEMKFDGKGPINAKQRQGILTQIFNILF
ncbi:flagellar basal body L-ring protein FlgH [Anaerosinus gibii]|uniref:Flagellar L-ring protein n=1 Tax=Selenobaculum gibii TaxID=3054208 RepID=A0A9Y2EU31_9FIRM|nr:flagellar basal body L-ring protein FlgH [Selenobaculum gbiensis]WIW71015.1 flagellar basal body L-ring protein FlgH [Selenobaculum gbiensis]